MNEEMQFRYLFYLTYMSTGTNKWELCYTAMSNFGMNIGHEKYAELIDKITIFNKKYSIKDL